MHTGAACAEAPQPEVGKGDLMEDQKPPSENGTKKPVEEEEPPDLNKLTAADVYAQFKHAAGLRHLNVSE